MKNEEKIIELFNRGLSNVEIGRELGYDNSQVHKAVKKLGLVRTPEQKSAIKSRSQLGLKYAKCKQKKFKKEYNRVSTYESKNYILDNIRKGLINTGAENLDADIQTSIESIQKLRTQFAKIPKFEKK